MISAFFPSVSQSYRVFPHLEGRRGCLLPMECPGEMPSVAPLVQGCVAQGEGTMALESGKAGYEFLLSDLGQVTCSHLQNGSVYCSK